MGDSMRWTVRKAARLAVYEEIMMRVKNHHIPATIRVDTDLINNILWSTEIIDMVDTCVLFFALNSICIKVVCLDRGRKSLNRDTVITMVIMYNFSKLSYLSYEKICVVAICILCIFVLKQQKNLLILVSELDDAFR
jgi:hypothetical protein